ncbi:MAG: hypothetical protein GX318_04845 [Clostridia bacterium]|nr:hypothetical protein [Clostridia bacterium]
MRTVNTDLDSIVGAVMSSTKDRRWFLDLKTGHTFIIDYEFQDEEEVEKILVLMEEEMDRYLPIPHLGHEDYLREVQVFANSLSNFPSLQELLEQAVKEKASRKDINRILNRAKDQGEKFNDYLTGRVREQVQLWLEKGKIKLQP